MSLAYVSSDAITTFPSSMRSQDVYSRFTTERNIVNIINQLTDNNCYVNNYDSSDGTIEFTIGGYYFRTTLEDILDALGEDTDEKAIYAIACVGYDGSAENIGDSRLHGYDGTNVQSSVDIDDEFIGLSFTYDPDEKPTDEGEYTFYYLQLFEKNASSEDWKVPEASYYKFSANSYDFNTLSNDDISNIFSDID